MNHLAIAISPVVATIARARKTRDLWASSFVFSRLMYHLLGELKEYGSIISPAYEGNENIGHKHGAGLWPDRCLVRLDDESLPDIDVVTATAFKKLAVDLGVKPAEIPQYFQVHALFVDWSKTDLETTAVDENDEIVIHRLNRLLDNLELCPAYRPQEENSLNDLLSVGIHPLYRAAQHQEDEKSIFLPVEYPRGDDNNGRARPDRLPSIPEIAMREFGWWDLANPKGAAYRLRLKAALPSREEGLPPFPQELEWTAIGTAYHDLVWQVLNDKVYELRQDGTGKRAKSIIDSQKYNEQFYVGLRKAFKKEPATSRPAIKLRHKYIAVVQLDGDGFGRAITRLSNPDEQLEGSPASRFKAFSDNLMRFSTEAVATIVDYGGLPIFAGGDDLLFLAPVAMPGAEIPNVFALCRQLDADLKAALPGHGVALSGGASISYYKFPLGEAVAKAGKLEKKAKAFELFASAGYRKKHGHPAVQVKNGKEAPLLRKNALTFEVRKHSGQTFGATLSMAAGASFQQVIDLLDPTEDIDAASLSSVMHKLQSMPFLFAEAAAAGRLDYFKTNHFNEDNRHEGAYMQAVMEFSKAIFREYGDQLTESGRPVDQTLAQELAKHHTNVVFSTLRFQQFLNQADHD